MSGIPVIVFKIRSIVPGFRKSAASNVKSIATTVQVTLRMAASARDTGDNDFHGRRGPHQVFPLFRVRAQKRIQDHQEAKESLPVEFDIDFLVVVHGRLLTLYRSLGRLQPLTLHLFLG